jgi:hypothetical protein
MILVLSNIHLYNDNIKTKITKKKKKKRKDFFYMDIIIYFDYYRNSQYVEIVLCSY